MFTFYLKDHTKFSLLEHFSEQLVAALLLRHMGQIVNNAHTMYGIVLSSDGSDIPMGQLQERARAVVIATALFPRTAILNHSCDPNIRNRFSGNVLTIHAVRPILGGTEIFNGYCPSYKLLDTSKRRQLLKEQYGFDCDCQCCAQSENSLLAVIMHVESHRLTNLIFISPACSNSSHIFVQRRTVADQLCRTPSNPSGGVPQTDQHSFWSVRSAPSGWNSIGRTPLWCCSSETWPRCSS